MKIKPEVTNEPEVNVTLKKPQNISVTIQNDSIVFGNINSEEKVSISFQRTLRIPDDDKIYPLPPTLGVFPIKKVDDYLDKVPEEWKKHGGIFIPMYQREAMWMEFKGNKNSPKAVKIAVGKINALSGEIWDQTFKEDVNDYVVIPDQPWLDGINAGDGTVRQFVAMPLGSGYTVEGQVTRKEEFGGIQLCVFAEKPYDDKKRIEEPTYPIEEPIEPDYPIEEPYSPYFPGLLPENTPQNVPYCLDGDMAIPESENFDFTYHVESLIPLSKAKIPKSVEKKISNQVVKKPTFSEVAKEMGIASGGKMKQKIYHDRFGYDNWDETNFGRIYVHIVNSAMYYQITGLPPPKSQITSKTYSDFGHKWYDIWD